MANVLEYTLSLQDKISSRLRTIGVSSDNAMNRFSALQRRTVEAGRVMAEMGRSTGSLRMQLDALRAEREWIPSSNIRDIQRYNREINSLEREIRNLESHDGSRIRRWANDAFGAIPGAELLRNPLVAIGVAAAYSAKSVLSFDQGMAKINTTAGLTEEGLDSLKTKLLDAGLEMGADPLAIPESFEKVISQVGNVDTSLSILKSSLAGAKAGFTDVDVVAGALAQSLSIIGAENATAQDVLDTLFAAKRVGAGEFADFANYMPGLIASGDALGIKYKEVAGMFAYMTGKGQSAERSATLMGNAFSAIGKKDIQDNLGKEGVAIFDKTGSIRDIKEIMGDLKARMAGLNDKGKSNFLERMGLVDKEAKSAMIIMTSDTEKLNEAMSDTANATGETAAALEKSKNGMQGIQGAWGKVKTLAILLGGGLMTLLNPALDVLNMALDGVLYVINNVAPAFAWFRNELHAGNPVLWGAIIALTAISTGLAATWLWTNRSVIATKLKVFWDEASAVATWLAVWATEGWAAAQLMLNGSMLANPITWIVALIVGMIAVIAWVIYAYDGWAEAWKHLVNYLVLSWDDFKNQFEVTWYKIRNSFLDGVDDMKSAWFGFKKIWNEDEANAGLNALTNQATERATELANAVSAGGAIQAALAAEAAGVKLHQNENKLGDLVNGAKNALGISSASIPGITPAGTSPAGVDDVDDPKGKKGKRNKSAEAIATGGQRNTTVNITIGNQIGQFTLTTSNLKEGLSEMRDMIIDEMTRAVAMGASLGGATT